MGPELLGLLGVVVIAVLVAFGVSVLVGLLVGVAPRPSGPGGAPMVLPPGDETITVAERAQASAADGTGRPRLR